MLKDTDPMPFGKYKGQPIGGVPASYLFWLEDNIKLKALNKQNLMEKALVKYIEENRDALNIEIKFKKQSNG